MKNIHLSFTPAIVYIMAFSTIGGNASDASFELSAPHCVAKPTRFVKNDTASIQIDITACLEGSIKDPVFPLREVDHMTDFYFVDENYEEVDIFEHHADVYRLYVDDGDEEEEWIETSKIDCKYLRIYWDDNMKDDDCNPLKKANICIEVEGYEPVFKRIKRPRHKSVQKIILKSK